MTPGAPAMVMVAFVLATVLGGSEAVRANGGTLRLARAEAGAYLVSVWTEPDPPWIGRLDVSVAVMRPQDGTAVLDVATTVAAQLVDDPTLSVKGQATRGGGGNLFLYHVELELPRPGRWHVTVTVLAPAGQGSASFEIMVVRGWRLIPLIVGAVAGAALAWMLARRLTRRT